MLLLGISAFYHDSAVAIIKDGKVLYASQEERFSRIKNDSNFPILALKDALRYCSITMNQIDGIAFYDKPFLKFERILENHLEVIPSGIYNFIKSTPSWINEKLFIERTIKKVFKKENIILKNKTPFYYPEHHLSHASSVFYTSPFQEATIITIDGVGEYNTTAIFHGKQELITKKAEINFPNSIGLLYSSFTYFLGFEVNKGEYKMMGLAPYGNIKDPQTIHYIKLIKNNLITINEDASYTLNLKYFSFMKGNKMIKTRKWEQLFNLKIRIDEIEQEHANLALAIQSVTEEIVEKIVLKGISITGNKNICLSGGIALNSVINGKLAENKEIGNLFVFPAPGDAGAAVGAALSAYHIGHSQERKVSSNIFNHGFLGPAVSKDEIEFLKEKHKGKVEDFHQSKELCSTIARSIMEDKIIGWVQGRMEFGPRAMGARSILANPYSNKTQKHVNLKIKKRESFRPFAPILLLEDLPRIASTCHHSNYMLQVHKINPEIREDLDLDFSALKWSEKLSQRKSKFPAVTHVDFSCRIQSVKEDNETKMKLLLNEIKNITGYGILVNTSFNSSNEPIVCSAEDAYSSFIGNDLDALVIENTVFWKNEK